MYACCRVIYFFRIIGITCSSVQGKVHVGLEEILTSPAALVIIQCSQNPPGDTIGRMHYPVLLLDKTTETSTPLDIHPQILKPNHFKETTRDSSNLPSPSLNHHTNGFPPTK